MNKYKITIDNTYLGKEIELVLMPFTTKEGEILYMVDHETFERIARENLNHVDISIRVCAASERYAAVQVTLKDQYGRYVSEVGDVNTYHPTGENVSYQKQHPLVLAKNNAFDAAVRKFIDIPRYFDPKECSQLADQIAENAEEAENVVNVLESEILNETVDENAEENLEDLFENHEESVEIHGQENTAEPVDTILTNPYAACVFPGGKYAGMTCAEVWKENPEYFNRTRAWKGYEDMAKFAEYMEGIV